MSEPITPEELEDIEEVYLSPTFAPMIHRLIAEVRRLRAEVERLRAELDSSREYETSVEANKSIVDAYDGRLSDA